MNRYTKFDGGYLDAYTGLIWKSHPEDGLFTFEEALKLESAEWRLPTIHELFGVVDTNRFEPATALPNHNSSAFWSGSPGANDPDEVWAWYVRFTYGNPGSGSCRFPRSVRLVRR